MFKKRSTKKKSEDEDDITVSVPQDLTDLDSFPTTTTSSRIPDEATVRKNAEINNTQPHQPWKPWDTQIKTMHGRRTSQNAKISPISSTITAVISSSETTATTTTTTTTSTSATTNISDNKSPGMMVNLTSMFSSAPPTPQQPQHVEAQLWNADKSITSPISPATPRYIPAIAGGAMNPRVNGTGNNGRLTTGWRSSNNRKSNDESTGRKSNQISSMQPSSPGLGITSSGSHAGSPSVSSRSTSVITSSQMSSSNHNGSFEKSNSKTTKSFGSAMSSSGYGNIQRTDSANSGTQNNTNARSYDRAQRNNTFISEDYDNPKDNFIGGKSQGTFQQMRHSAQSRGYYDDNELEDRKKDRHLGRSHKSSLFPSIFRDPRRVFRSQLFCLRQNRRLHPAIRLIVIFLLGGSVLYTTFHLIFRESNTKDKLRKSFDYTEQQLRVQKLLSQAGTPRKKPTTIFDVEAQKYSIYQWKLGTFDMNNSKATARISEDYMLSKAYNGAMQPTRVIPFYFKASFKDENDDDDIHEDDNDGLRKAENDSPNEHITHVQVDPSMVTITTLITPDRYGVFLKLVKQYRGPISVATHIRQGPDQDKMFHELQEFFRENPILRRYVDLHVIVDGVDFQLNMWRNVARMFARTDYFMLLDVDFHIPSSLKNNLHHDPRVQELLAAGCALVVPAFEYDIKHDPKDSKYFPDTKAELTKLVENKHIRVFHDFFPPGHAATDTPRWIRMSKGSDSGRILRPANGNDNDHTLVPEGNNPDGVAIERVDPITPEEQEEYLEQEADGERPYKVTAFEPKYEPYIVLKREGTPWCDERFVGYGGNKAACLFEIYISGIDFWVMPQDFLIHQYHDYPATNRKNGRILNKQLFTQFQQEICFLTLKRMIITGEWYTSKADNLRHQCSAFEDFLQLGDEWAEEFEAKHPGSLLQDPVFVADLSPELKKQKIRLDLSIHSFGSGWINPEDDSPIDNKADKPLGDQVVNDEDHQDPFMSRPKGKVWGGIQPRKYYIPPPPEPGYDIPIGGIDVDAAISGDQLVLDSNQEKKDHSDDLAGEKLEQFRQGIIVPDGLDSGSQYESHEHDSSNETNPVIHDDGENSDDYHGVDSDNQLQSESRSSPDESFDYSQLTFEEAAEKLEERYRQLGVLSN